MNELSWASTNYFCYFDALWPLVENGQERRSHKWLRKGGFEGRWDWSFCQVTLTGFPLRGGCKSRLVWPVNYYCLEMDKIGWQGSIVTVSVIESETMFSFLYSIVVILKNLSLHSLVSFDSDKLLSFASKVHKEMPSAFLPDTRIKKWLIVSVEHR